MKKLKTMLPLLAAVLLAAGVRTNAAVTYTALVTELPYSHVYTTVNESADDQFHYKVESESPLPQEADTAGVFVCAGTSGTRSESGGQVTFTLAGKLHFRFPAPGVYEYVIGADSAADSAKTDAENYTFETRQYTVRFYIENGTTEGSLRLAGVTITESGPKKEVLELTADYHGQPETTEPETTEPETTEPETTEPETTEPETTEPETSEPETTEPETEPETPPETPKTGDGPGVGFYAGLGVCSAVMLAVLAIENKRRGEKA